MEEKELLQKIAILTQKKYNGYNELETLTKQLQDALQYGDVVTIRMLIKMRQQEMDVMDGFSRERNSLLEGLSEAQKNALKNGDSSHFSGEAAPLAEKIAEIQQKNKRLLERLIALDKRVSLKLAGEKSYYHQNG